MMGGKINRQIRAAALGTPEKGSPPSNTFLKGDGEVWRLSYKITPDFIAFRGHFEGRPVLPALAQVLIAKDSVATVLERNVVIETITQAKFLALVLPGSILSVYARPPEGGELGEWRFHITTQSEADLLISDVSYLRLKIGVNLPADEQKN